VGRAALVLVLAFACNDVRAFHGSWRGSRVGDAPVLRVGFTQDATAALTIASVDTHGLTGKLTVSGLVQDTDVASLAGAEADVLAGMTFAGSPMRVFLAFVDVMDGGGQAMAMIALYDDRRVELRLLRGGASPLYGIFALAEDTP